MCEIVVYGIGILEGVGDIVFSLVVEFILLVVLVVPLLNEDLGAKLFQELVSLPKQLVDLAVLSLLELVEVLGHVLFLEKLQTNFGLFIFLLILVLLPFLVKIAGLASHFLPLLVLLAVELSEFLLVQPHHLQHLFMLSLLSLLVVALHLILQLFDPVARVLCSLQFFPPVVIPIQQLRFEKSQRFVVLVEAINNTVHDLLVDGAHGGAEELGLDLEFEAD